MRNKQRQRWSEKDGKQKPAGEHEANARVSMKFNAECFFVLFNMNVCFSMRLAVFAAEAESLSHSSQARANHSLFLFFRLRSMLEVEYRITMAINCQFVIARIV